MTQLTKSIVGPDLWGQIQAARTQNAFVRTKDSLMELRCGCGYDGNAPYIDYSRIEQVEDNTKLTICPNCGSA